jgi:hypothetical protein
MSGWWWLLPLWPLCGLLSVYLLGIFDRRVWPSQGDPERVSAATAVTLLAAGPVGVAGMVLGFAMAPLFDRVARALDWCEAAGRSRLVSALTAAMRWVHTRGWRAACRHDWEPEHFAGWRCARCGKRR